MEFLPAERQNCRNSKKPYIIATLSVCALLSLIFILKTQSSSSFTVLNEDSLLHAEFQNFISKHHKNYKDDLEYQSKYEAFKSNQAKILKVNQESRSYKLGTTKFADMTKEEFSSLLTAKYQPAKKPVKSLKTSDFPSQVDWRQEGHVTQVKDQGYCGSCWAFATVAAVESLVSITYGKTTDLSEQELVDCSGNFGNLGCDGGYLEAAFDYMTVYGISNEWMYRYRGEDGFCRVWDTLDPQVTLSEYGYVQPNDWAQLVIAIYYMPITVIVDATEWGLYTTGVFDSTDCSTELNHAVLAVGFDLDRGFYIIKNSWGTDWGEDGFIRLTIEEGEGTCGVQMHAIYPVL
jgi:C1A family cysteine protease